MRTVLAVRSAIWEGERVIHPRAALTAIIID